MRSIRHPNLVSLFKAWHKDNLLILAMELCEGTLLDRLNQVRGQKLPGIADAVERRDWEASLNEVRAPTLPGIPVKELLGYMGDVANGLDALNANQVQHRDIKPANLLLGSGAKVGDFGLAKVLEHTVATNSGAGALAYTAPECFKDLLAQQSDRYSLAATYYHLRSGHPLFQGNQAQVMYGQLELEPNLSGLPRPERAVLARALSKKPGKRWPNCKAFVNELNGTMNTLIHSGIGGAVQGHKLQVRDTIRLSPEEIRRLISRG